jgi:hypothetical protein
MVSGAVGSFGLPILTQRRGEAKAPGNGKYFSIFINSFCFFRSNQKQIIE